MNKMDTFKNLTEGTFVKLTGMSVKNENDIFVVDCDYRIAGKYTTCHDERCLNKVKLNGEKKTGGYDLVFLNNKMIEKNSNIEIEIVTDLKKAKKEVNNYLNGVTSEEIVVTYKISENQNIEKGSIIRFKKGLTFGMFGGKRIGKNSIFVVAGCEKTLWIQRLGKKGQVLSLLDDKNSYNFSENLYKKVIDEEYIEIVEKIETKKGDIIKENKVKSIKVAKTNTVSAETTTKEINNIDTTNTVLDHVTVTPDVNTKTGANIFVVKLNNKIEYDTFKTFEAEIKTIGGYYSRFKRGFIFTEDPTEKLLTIDASILTGATQNINKEEEVESNLHTEDIIELNNDEDVEILNSITITEDSEEVTTVIEQPQDTTIKPISIEHIEDQNIRIKGIFAALNKNNTIEEYKEEIERDCYTNTCKITDIVTLSPEDYEIFVHNFLTDYDFIAEKGGVNSDYETDKTEIYQLTKDEMTQFRKQSYNLCVMIKAEGKESILVDPQGYNYSRYVAFMDEQPQQDKEPIEASHDIKEESKVINITENINKNTNSIDSNTNNNNTDTTDTKELSPEEQHIKNLFKSALNEIIQDQIPSFNHEIKYKTNKAKIIDFTNYKHKKA